MRESHDGEKGISYSDSAHMSKVEVGASRARNIMTMIVSTLDVIETVS